MTDAAMSTDGARLTRFEALLRVSKSLAMHRSLAELLSVLADHLHPGRAVRLPRPHAPRRRRRVRLRRPRTAGSAAAAGDARRRRRRRHGGGIVWQDPASPGHPDSGGRAARSGADVHPLAGPESRLLAAVDDGAWAARGAEFRSALRHRLPARHRRLHDAGRRACRGRRDSSRNFDRLQRSQQELTPNATSCGCSSISTRC